MKAWRKLLIIAIIAAVLGVSFFIDFSIAKSYDLSIAELSPDPVPADGQTPVDIKIRVKHKGKFVQGHVINGLSKNGGGFKSVRVVTDENGIASFLYYPYLKTNLNTLTDINLEFTNESNSKIISVPAKLDMTLNVIEPNNSEKDALTTDDIF